MAALPLFSANCEIRADIRFYMNWPESSEIVKCRFCKNVCLTFSISSGVTRDGRPLRFPSCTLVRPSVNCSYHHLTILSFIMSSPYTWHNWRWISVRECFWACRNLITAQLSQLARDNFSAVILSKCCAITTAVIRLKLQWIILTYSLSTDTHEQSRSSGHTISGRDWNLLPGSISYIRDSLALDYNKLSFNKSAITAVFRTVDSSSIFRCMHINSLNELDPNFLHSCNTLVMKYYKKKEFWI